MGPFDHLRTALEAGLDELAGADVRPDGRRRDRTASPEVISGANKTVAQILAAIEALIPANGRVLVSQTTQLLLDELSEALPANVWLEPAQGSRAAVAVLESAAAPQVGGRVAVISAGTSDVPVAAEAALVAREMGCDVQTTWDVGVAGIHRLVRPLEGMIEWDADAFIVAAGMDGILPTIVSGLVSQPIIGLPVSTGYGFGGHGVGALTTMLQTCSPGLAVVNIDNGVGAGITAGRIAIRAARGRVDRDT